MSPPTPKRDIEDYGERGKWVRYTGLCLNLGAVAEIPGAEAARKSSNAASNLGDKLEGTGSLPE